MSKINKVIFIFGILAILVIFSFSLQINNNQNDEKVSDKNKVILEDNDDNVVNDKPKSALIWEVPFIHIKNDNWSQNDLDWIQNRTGTWNDRHVIENVTINSGGSILIENSNEPFIIRNCTVLNAIESGIVLFYSHNGTITNNNCSLNTSGNYYSAGIVIDHSNNNTISENILKYNYMGINFTQSLKNEVSANVIDENDFEGIKLDDSHNNSIKSNIISNSNFGILFLGSNDTTVYGNIMNGNANSSWYELWGSGNNNFSWNAVNNRIDPVIIDENGGGNFSWAQAASKLAWCTGSGTWNDPYLLENLIISGENSSSCLIIRDSIVCFKIQNCYIYNCSYMNGGLFLNNASNGQIIDNNCSLNNFMGMIMLNSNNNTIVGNIFNNNIYGGLNANHIQNNTISGNEIYDNGWYGITLYSNSNNNTISNNFVKNNNIDGIYLDNCFNHRISGNNITDNKENGIYLIHSNNNSILENIIYTNSKDGICFSNSIYNNISGNNIYNNRRGVFLGQCYENYLSNNTIFGNSLIGVENYNCQNSTLKINKIYNNRNGILLEACNNFTIAFNEIYSNVEIGIYLINTNFSSIKNNTINNNSNYGIKLNPSNYNTITGNILIGNQGGIYEDPSCIGNFFAFNTIQNRPSSNILSEDDDDDDDDDGELSSLFSGQNLILLLILIIPLAVMGMIAGKTTGDLYTKSKLRKELGADESLKGIPKIAKTLDWRKNDLAKLEEQINKMESDRALRIKQIQTEIQKKEREATEERLKQRLELQEEYNTAYSTLENLKNDLGEEISRRAEFGQDLNELKLKKQQIEENMTQIQLEHEKNLNQIKLQTLVEEQEWAQRRIKMKQDIELDWQNKISKMEEEKHLAQNNLENQIKIEEERRIQLQKKNSLNEERLKIIESLKELEEGLLNNIESRLKTSELSFRKIAEDINAYPDIDTKPEIVTLNSLIFTKIGNVISLLERQGSKETISEGIISKLSRIDAHIRSLTSKMEMQRSAPVLTLPPLQRKGRFSIFNDIEFLCELCHKSMLTVEVKERRLWVKWALLGAKSIMNLSKLGFLVDVIVKKPSMEFKRDKLIDEFKEGRLTDLINEIHQGDLDLSEDLMSFAKEIQKEPKVGLQALESYEETILKFNNHFNEVIKKGYTFEELINIFTSKEKVLWQLYSQGEQENIRTFLKDSGNSTLYTADLQLRHGLFVCDECRKWIDNLEEKQNKPRGETNFGE